MGSNSLLPQADKLPSHELGLRIQRAFQVLAASAPENLRPAP